MAEAGANDARGEDDAAKNEEHPRARAHVVDGPVADARAERAAPVVDGGVGRRDDMAGRIARIETDEAHQDEDPDEEEQDEGKPPPRQADVDAGSGGGLGLG